MLDQFQETAKVDAVQLSGALYVLMNFRGNTFPFKRTTPYTENYNWAKLKSAFLLGFLLLKLINFTTKLPNWTNISYYRAKLWGRRGICVPTRKIILHQIWRKITSQLAEECPLEILTIIYPLKQYPSFPNYDTDFPWSQRLGGSRRFDLNF